MSEATTILISAAISGLVAFFVARASTRFDYAIARKSRAAENLTPMLYELQDLVIVAHAGMVSGREFSGAMVRWNSLWKANRASLPRGWGHIDRSARAAIGEFIGLPAAAAYDRRVWDASVADYSWAWQTNAEFYLGHLAGCVARCDERRPPMPERFDDWLKFNDVRKV